MSMMCPKTTAAASSESPGLDTMLLDAYPIDTETVDIRNPYSAYIEVAYNATYLISPCVHLNLHLYMVSSNRVLNNREVCHYQTGM